MIPQTDTGRAERIALVALIVLTSVLFWKVLLLGEVSITYNLFHELPWKSEATPEQIDRPSMNPDCVQSYFPRRAFATHVIRSGEIPLWNPYDFCGAPFLANFQSAVFYPVNLILYLVDPLRAMGYYLYFHFLLAGCFGFLFLRSLRAGVFASFAGASVILLCGFLTTRTGHPTFVATAAWVPAVLWCLERLFQKPTLGRTVWLGFSHAACVLAGFPQIAFHTTYLLGAYTLWRAWTKRGSGSWKVVLRVVGAMALSGAVATVQILPTYEFVQFCSRRFLPYGSVLSGAHNPVCLVKYLVPDFFGNPLDGTVWSNWLKRGDGYFSQNYVSSTGYVGILPLLLAWVGMFSVRRGRWFFFGTAGVCLLVVFGTPLLRLAYLLPGFNFSRVDRLIFIYMVAVAVLAGFGADALGTGLLPRKRIFIPILATACLAWIVLVWVNAHPERVYRAITNGLFVPAAGWEDVRTGALKACFLMTAGAVLIALGLWNRLPKNVLRGGVALLILTDLLFFGYRFNISRPYEDAFPPTKITDQLHRSPVPTRIMHYGSDVLFPNTPSVYGIADAHGYNALTLDYYMELVELIQPPKPPILRRIVKWPVSRLKRRVRNLSRPESLDSPIADLLSVEYFLTTEESAGDSPRAVAVANPGALPRAFFARRAEVVADRYLILGLLSRPDFDPREVVYLTPGDPEGMEDVGGESPDPEAPAGRVRILEYGPNEIVLETMRKEAGWLVLAETYYPGWKAWVDERPAAIRRADHALRAIRVPAGRHRVRFEYSPRTFRLGATISLLALGAGIAGLVYRRRPSAEETS